jgi:hypothetical protein
MVPKRQGKISVLNLSDQVRILNLLKGGMSLAEVGRLKLWEKMNQASLSGARNKI